MYNFQITALCISLLYARCSEITFLRKSQPHRACLSPDKAAHIFSIHLGFYCGKYNTQQETVYHIWSACPSFFQLTVLFICKDRFHGGVGWGEVFLGFAAQPACTHPPSFYNIPGKKTHTTSPGQCECKKEVIFQSSDPMSVSGLLSP